jgi:hypothetical protein
VGRVARPVRPPGLALRTPGAAVRAPGLAVQAEATSAMVARIAIMAGFIISSPAPTRCDISKRAQAMIYQQKTSKILTMPT